MNYFLTVESDGLQLSAWHIPSKQGEARPVVLIAHGIGANKQNLLPVAEEIHAWGYHVVLLDFRAHGDSEGLLCTFGLNETADIKAACDWIAQRHPSQPIHGLGYSMGGAALVRACAEHGLCDKIILDCTFARLQNSFRQTMEGYYLPAPLIAAWWQATRLCGWTIAGVDLQDAQPELCMDRLADRALFIIHGKSDGTTPFTDSLTLAEQVNGQAEVWLVEGAGHFQALMHPEYCARIRRFLAAKSN